MWQFLLGGIGTFFKGLFGMKSKQADVITTALKTLGETHASEAQKEVAQAQVLASIYQSDSWLAKNWRPLLMLTFAGMLISSWFGYIPPFLLKEMPPILGEIFGLIKIGLGGYIGARSLEKIVGSMNLGTTIKKFIEKKIV